MSDLDFDKLLTERLAQGQAEQAFRARLKQQSGQALMQGHHRRLWYRRTSLIAAVVLVAMSAFFSGRMTVKPEPPNGSLARTNPDPKGDTVLVARDLVTWLEAARFFKQLGMEERAQKSFRLASSLTPSAEQQNQVVSQKTQTRFESHVEKGNSLSSLLARCDTHIQQQQSLQEPKVIPIVNKKHVPIIAQIIGGRSHDD
jgi:hypothetical protein